MPLEPPKTIIVLIIRLFWIQRDRSLRFLSLSEKTGNNNGGSSSQFLEVRGRPDVLPVSPGENVKVAHLTPSPPTHAGETLATHDVWYFKVHLKSQRHGFSGNIHKLYGRTCILGHFTSTSIDLIFLCRILVEQTVRGILFYLDDVYYIGILEKIQ